MRPYMRPRWRTLHIPHRTRPSGQFIAGARSLPSRSRSFADDPKTKAEHDANIDRHLGRTYDDLKDEVAKQEGQPGVGEGPNMDQLPHITEETAAVSRAKGDDSGPEVEQGTKVSEVAKDDKDLERNLPKVMREQLERERKQKEGAGGGQKRGFATYARARQAMGGEVVHTSEGGEATLLRRDPDLHPDAIGKSIPQLDRERLQELKDSQPGLKFPAPQMPLPPGSHLKRRYDPVVEQVTNLLMRDGKKSVAQNNMSLILNHLRTAPAPNPTQRYALVAATPAAHHLPLNPIAFLTSAIDSVAPLFRVRALRGVLGGGMVLQLPTPLRLRQRRRTAVAWIMDAVDKRGRAAANTSPFAKRFAEELVAVVEGRSSVWEKRQAVHVLGVRSRSNLEMMARAGGAKGKKKAKGMK